MPARSAVALYKQRVRRRNHNREWKKKNPEKVREQKRRYRVRKKLLGVVSDALNRWKKKNRCSLLPRTRRSNDEYDPDEILRGLIGVRVVVTDFRKTPLPPSVTPQRERYDSDEILRGLFANCQRSPSPSLLPFPVKAVTLRSFITTTPNTSLTTPQRRERRLSYSSSDSDSEPDEGLVLELERLLAEPEDPVRQRLTEIRKNRKKAEENRAKRILEEQKMVKMITEIAEEMDEMTFMLHDMGRWFAQFEREDTVEQNLCHLPVSNDFMDQLERHLFSS